MLHPLENLHSALEFFPFLALASRKHYFIYHFSFPKQVIALIVCSVIASYPPTSGTFPALSFSDA